MDLVLKDKGEKKEGEKEGEKGWESKGKEAVSFEGRCSSKTGTRIPSC